MPAETFSKPLENILDKKCDFEYYDWTSKTFTSSPRRICHVTLENQEKYNENVVLMVFTIRNQSGKWKVHSEGAQRVGSGDTVPLKNNAVKLAKENGWKYCSIALAGENTPSTELISQYVVSIESYAYGNETVCDLTDVLESLKKMGCPNFYRCKIKPTPNGHAYSFAFIKKEFFIDYLSMIDNRNYNDDTEEIIEENKPQGEIGTNIILYGVPGCGKSHTIEEEYCKDELYMERVVFHPDYTFSDFVGQILPQVNNGVISYPFVEGPFTKILRKAVNDEDKKMYYLVIEEINRGNAPAIFGEIFQLLDRENGISEYGITNFDIARKVYGEDKKDEKIRIPANLTILATMNTADQNVFTLDTAFKRRWEMKCIENNFDKCNFADKYICGTSVTWRTFADKINNAILDINQGSLSNEDARLGAFFIKEKDLYDVWLFSEKVLMYLWTDAFKRDREQVFNPTYRTLEELVKGFREHKFDVFNSQFGFNNAPNSEENLNVDVKEYLNEKKPELVTLYEQLIDAIGSRIENINQYTTKSKQYIGIGSANCSKKSFVEVKFKSDCISLEMTKPLETRLLLGTEIPRDGHHDHYYKIDMYDTNNIDDIVSAVCDSYNQLKKEN